MYICICKNVTDSQIKQAIDDGHKTLRCLKRELGVASECGKCGKCAKRLLQEHDIVPRDTITPVFFPVPA